MLKGSDMVCHTYCGALDLYYGIPNLMGAEIVSIEKDEKSKGTRLVFRKVDHGEYSITILPAN